MFFVKVLRKKSEQLGLAFFLICLVKEMQHIILYAQ